MLLVAFQLKHLIADYYLQYPFMYENKGKATGWLIPLSMHSFTHASIVVTIAGFAGATLELALIAALIDFGTHFAIDRWKATQPEVPDTSKFWTNLGIDQMLHHLVGIGIVYILVTT